MIKKINFSFILPRHWTDMLSQFDLRSCAVRRACKNFSGLTSYFTERKARYSPIDGLCLISLHLLLLQFKIAFVSDPLRLVPPVPSENIATLIRLKISRFPSFVNFLLSTFYNTNYESHLHAPFICQLE